MGGSGPLDQVTGPTRQTLAQKVAGDSLEAEVVTRRSRRALGCIGMVPGRSPSWKLADLAITAELRGILFSSLRHAGGTNLVVFPANRSAGGHDSATPDQNTWSSTLSP
ncbi:MAG: hypothetical protein R3D70_23965 [Rhizobiaceae bacterium]